jgi:hypothetical protein
VSIVCHQQKTMAGIFGPVEQVPDRLVRLGNIKSNHPLSPFSLVAFSSRDRRAVGGLADR